MQSFAAGTSRKSNHKHQAGVAENSLNISPGPKHDEAGSNREKGNAEIDQSVATNSLKNCAAPVRAREEKKIGGKPNIRFAVNDSRDGSHYCATT